MINVIQLKYHPKKIVNNSENELNAHLIIIFRKDRINDINFIDYKNI